MVFLLRRTTGTVTAYNAAISSDGGHRWPWRRSSLFLSLSLCLWESNDGEITSARIFTTSLGAERHLLFAVLEAILVILVTERLDKKRFSRTEQKKSKRPRLGLGEIEKEGTYERPRRERERVGRRKGRSWTRQGCRESMLREREREEEEKTIRRKVEGEEEEEDERSWRDSGERRREGKEQIGTGAVE